MPCYSPIMGYRAKRPNPNGKYPITFTKSEGYSDLSLTIPCGKCIGCRLEHSRQWAVRCMHEAKMHENSCFVTLTYNDENVPTIMGYPTLVKKDLQLFMKRLRNKFGSGVKFYACGEYGETTSRPHYHVCIFGVDFDDKVLYTIRNENKLYTSKTLDELWTDPKTEKQLGFTTIGALTFETAAYTARYCMKKWKGKNWESHYEVIDPDTGEIQMIQPEFALMSRRPGIGKSFFDVYKKEIIDNDSVITNGREMKPPKYYDAQIEKESSKLYEQLKAERREAAKKAVENNSLARLHTRGICKKAQITRLKREI